MVYTSLLSDPSLYLCSILTIVVALMPDMLIQVIMSSQIKLKPKANKTTPFIATMS